MHKGAFYSLLGAIAILVIGGTYAYAQRPERAVSNAAQKLAQAKTGHFHAVISLADNPAAKSILTEATSMNVTLDGSFDRHGEERDSVVSDIVLNAKGDSVTLEIGGELRLIGDKAYLLVKKAPAAIPLLAKLKDTWAELPRGANAESAVSAAGGPLFHGVKSAGREEIAGKPARKYEATATEQGIINFMDNIASLLGTQLTDQQISDLRANLEKADSLPVTLWITPWRQELVQLTADLPGNAVRYTIMFSDRNQDVAHAIPEGSRPIKEVLGE